MEDQTTDEMNEAKREMNLGSLFGDEEDRPQNEMEDWFVAANHAFDYFRTREKDENYDHGVFREMMNQVLVLHEKAVRQFGG